MSRPMLIVAVSLAAYCLLDLALSVIVAVVWRTRAVAPIDLPPAVRARRLVTLRLLPATLACFVTAVIVAPAFAIFEPPGKGEAVGPALAMLATAGALQLTIAILTAARSALMTARVERAWARGASSLDVSAGVSTLVIESAAPIVALVGIFRPKLVAARQIIEACGPDDVARIVGHERGHLRARDNMKRWLMASLPDVLRWTPIHREIAGAWHHAAEDAADDEATGDDVVARAELAALLLKVVRLVPQSAWSDAIVSPFVEDDHGLERRVRRLLKPEREAAAPLAVLPMLLAAAIAGAMLATLSSQAALRAIFDAFETLVALGR